MTEKQSALLQSLALHVSLAGVFIGLLYFQPQTKTIETVEMDVIENPRLAPQPVPPEPLPIKKVPPVRSDRGVFGISRNTVLDESASSGISLKQGNTVAKTPDNLQLKNSDPDQLPIPTDDYLVTAMPKLTHDYLIPYPPEARKEDTQGGVVIDLLIDDQGRVRTATLVRGKGKVLDDAALEAVFKLGFSPALVGEKKVAVKIRYIYRFDLN